MKSVLPSREGLIKGVKIGVGVTFALQAAAIAALVAVDETRKRRHPVTGEFPHADPTSVDVSGSKVTTFSFGRHLFNDMLEEIDNATESVYFETFIWKKDETGQKFRDALIRAAERGVKVHIIVDTFGNLNQDPRFRYFPKNENLHVIRFPLLRLGILMGDLRNSGRDHRKILVVDSKTAYVGGYNIGDLYADHWRDTHMKIVGPQAWELENAFVDMWNSHRPFRAARINDQGISEWTSRVRAVQNLPSRLSFPIRSAYLSALDRANDHAWITMGYFIPDKDLQYALRSAAKRGVDVRILIPQYSNHVVADWVGRPHYGKMLDAGVRIFLYQDAMVHSKTMTVDSIWSTIGTANLDRLSMAGNFEVNLEMYSDQQAKVMRDMFELDLTNAEELTSERWNRRSTYARVIERILRPLEFIL